MKVWYSKKWDMYFNEKDNEDRDMPDDLVEMEVTKEEFICEGGDDDPSGHAERWEMEFYDEDTMISILTKIPWKNGKYKITIEEIK